MSQYFGGVTFPQQHLTAADDANVRTKIFEDCILKGCAFSESGFLLTMDAGCLMIKGRQIRHPFSQSWLIEQSSGFARLLLTVEVTWTDGKETGFDISAAIDYAATVQDFPEPQQQDINNGGSIYQTLLCIVSLDASGITDYADQIVTLEGG